MRIARTFDRTLGGEPPSRHHRAVPTSAAVDWRALWSTTATHLDRHREVGLQGLLTEVVLRFAVVQELVSVGVSPAHIATEWRRPGVPDAVDLVVSQPTWTAVEFKFPREPREANAAWTQHLGEVLKDFYRLAMMPPEFVDRWCVQLLSNRMRRYLDGVADPAPRHVRRLARRSDGARSDCGSRSARNGSQGANALDR